MGLEECGILRSLSLLIKILRNGQKSDEPSTAGNEAGSEWTGGLEGKSGQAMSVVIGLHFCRQRGVRQGFWGANLGNSEEETLGEARMAGWGPLGYHVST